MELIGLIILAISLGLLLICNELRYERLREDFETFRELTLEALNKYQKDLDDLSDFSRGTTKTIGLIIQEMRGESRE